MMKLPVNNISPKTMASTLKLLTITVTALMAMPTTQADVPINGTRRNVGDLEIYQQSNGGQINLMMMLDTSGSMGISSLVLPANNAYGSPGDVTTSLCDRKINTETGGNVTSPTFNEWAYNAKDSSGNTAFKRTVTVNKQSISYYLRGCAATGSTTPSIDANGNLLESDTGKFDRLSRMKQALISLILSNKIPSNVAIGLGNFSTRTPLTIGTSSIKLVDGHSGTILVPSALLTDAQKEKLVRAIAQFKSVDNFTNEDGTSNSNRTLSTTTPPDEYKASSGTPTAHAYAEAAAYMMGTTTGNQTQATSVSLVYDGYAILKDNTYSPGTQTYWVCDTLGTGTTTGPGGTTVYQCDNNWPIIDNQSNKYVTDVGIDQDAGKVSRNTRVYDQNGVLQTRYPATTITRNASTIWKIIDNFPVGWRFGGWRKVANEPMDIEPVTGKAWTTPARGDGSISSGGYGLFAYRTSPFSLSNGNISTTSLDYDACPSGYQIDTGWPSLCYQSGTWLGNATPVKGSDPITNVYAFDPSTNKPTGAITTDNANANHTNPYNKNYNGTYYKYTQDRWYVARPVKNVTTTTTAPVDNNVGGFTYSVSTSKNGSNYIRGATATNSSTAQCDANGIYFLTDGAPNSTKDSMAKTILNTSLNNDTKYTITSKPSGLTSPDITSNLFPGETGGWEWIGEYAKRLNDATKNPSGVAIKTAVAGFGSSFAGLTKNTDGSYNCDTAGATDDAKNACKWGQKGAGYGEGGFFYTQTADDISNSLINFIKSLNNTIPAAPSGTITIPKDPYRAIGELSYAFMPTLESQVSGDNSNNNIWPGNVKKYNLYDGSLFGQSNSAVFTNLKGDLNTSTQDLWQSGSDYQVANPKTGALETHNEAVKAGGVYQNLSTPADDGATVATTRTIWIEDSTTATTTAKPVAVTSTMLRQISIGADGKPLGVGDINDQITYTRANKIKLLKFMGFEQAKVSATADPQPLDAFLTTSGDLKDLILVQPSTPIKVLGASVHSKPVSVSYSATLSSGRVQDTGRDDYVLFGSMDGALHLVDADNQGTNDGGKETLAIIPRIMMINQADALVPNSTYTPNTTDTNKPIRPAMVPYFGIDGNWIVKAKYTYGTSSVAVNSTDGLIAYGGMRLGGKGLLSYNLTTQGTPTIGFSGSSDDGAINSALIDNNTTGFERIGYIWSQPTIARMKTSADDTGTEVLIFGGGYDKCYENEYFQVGVTSNTTNNIDSTCAAKTQADGNAVYIINANTGKLLWSATYDSTASGSFDGKKYMKNSIVGGITALDRNNDGFIDQLYFDDLGGQVFRADFKDSIVGTGPTNNTNGRIVRVLKDNQEGTSNARRFYERPNVSFYRNPSDNKLFAVINAISGDRSSPLSKIRTTKDTADRIYGVIDTDVTTVDATFYANNFAPIIRNLAVGDTTGKALQELGASTLTATDKTTKTNALKNYTYRGWYYPLTKFDGYDNVKYSKGVGKSEVIGSQLFTTVYNPDMNYSASDPCSARIIGGSEREMYCLPWGICDDATSTNGTGGYERAGQGIQELNFGPQSSTQLDQRLMIGTLTMTDVSATANRRGFGSDSNKGLSTTNTDGSNTVGLQNQGGTDGATTGNGNGSMPRDIFVNRYVLTPKQWYEQN